ncbi:MAG: ABC transporter permease [Pseudomonadota bacterium]
MFGVAFLGPLFATGSGEELNTMPFGPSVAGSLLGGDDLGRDVLSRTLNGGATLLVLAVLATALGLIIGTAAGIWAAFRGGWADTVVMRIVDIILAIPTLVFALLLLSMLGPMLWLVIVAVGLSHAPQVARVVYGAAQDLVERDFVKAVALMGVPSFRIMRREILPNLSTVLLVEVGLRLSYSIIIISGLSYLGFGVQPPTPDWGVMINENRLGLGVNSWGVLAPAILIALLAVGTNILADAIARAGLGEDRANDLPNPDSLGGR